MNVPPNPARKSDMIDPQIASGFYIVHRRKLAKTAA